MLLPEDPVIQVVPVIPHSNQVIRADRRLQLLHNLVHLNHTCIKSHHYQLTQKDFVVCSYDLVTCYHKYIMTVSNYDCGFLCQFYNLLSRLLTLTTCHVWPTCVTADKGSGVDFLYFLTKPGMMMFLVCFVQRLILSPDAQGYRPCLLKRTGYSPHCWANSESG